MIFPNRTPVTVAIPNAKRPRAKIPRVWVSRNRSAVMVDPTVRPKKMVVMFISSFWLAWAELDDDTLLLEADLVFDTQLVSQLVSMDESNVAVVDRYQPSMDGTVILASGDFAESMILKSDQGRWFDYRTALKTVNIYRLSRETLANVILPEMEAFLNDGRTGQYYEAVFASLIASGRMEMAVLNTGNKKWAEIDTLDDLKKAEKMFAAAPAAIG